MLRHPTITIFCLTTAISAAALAASDERFAAVQMKAHHVSGSVHMLEGAGGNIGVSVGADGTLIVDDQYAPLADKIIDALEGLGGGRPKLILNTHFHGDHAGSNPEMGTTGTIISHDNVRVRLLTQKDFSRSGLPLVTYDDDITVHFNDDKIRLIHVPAGHTDGDSVVWFKNANVIHMGDQFFNGGYPFIDIASGGTVDGFISNVEHVLSLLPEDIKVIPGHGPLATRQDLATAIAVIKKSSGEVRTALAKGEDAQKIATRLTADYPTWGSGFIPAERWVQIIQADADR